MDEFISLFMDDLLNRFIFSVITLCLVLGLLYIFYKEQFYKMAKAGPLKIVLAFVIGVAAMLLFHPLLTMFLNYIGR